jgi:hypothetical protein
MRRPSIVCGQVCGRRRVKAIGRQQCGETVPCLSCRIIGIGAETRGGAAGWGTALQEGRSGFDSWWCHWDFSVAYSFRPHCDTGFDSDIDITTFICWLSRNLRASNCWKTQGPYRNRFCVETCSVINFKFPPCIIIISHFYYPTDALKLYVLDN